MAQVKETKPERHVWDECSGEEEYPSSDRLSTVKETEPVESVQDEFTGDEEYPFIGGFIYDSSPIFDEYEDREWYVWATGDVLRKNLVEAMDSMATGSNEVTTGETPLMPEKIMEGLIFTQD